GRLERLSGKGVVAADVHVCRGFLPADREVCRHDKGFPDSLSDRILATQTTPLPFGSLGRPSALARPQASRRMAAARALALALHQASPVWNGGGHARYVARGAGP